MEDLVNVIMPVRNAEAYLTDCVQSVLDQSEEKWELLAVDDRSTDHSLQILKDFAEKDKRIRVYQSDGKGIIPALMTGYLKCSGNFITRMDADDVMSTDKLKMMKSTLGTHGPGYIAVGFVKYFSQEELGDGYRRYETWLNTLTDQGENFKEIYKECVIPSPCWMVLREDFERCGGFQAKSYPEDYDLCFRFYREGMKIAPIRKVLHHWRDHSERTSRNDPNYADNRFLAMKSEYFLEIDRDRSKPMIIWGAGKKGKKLAQIFTERNEPFQWVCNNIEKIGKKIYETELESTDVIKETPPSQIIIAVANPREQTDILESLDLDSPAHAVYLFC